MNRDQLISLFFILLLVFVLYQVSLIFLPFVQAMFWAAILSFGSYPLYKKLKHSWKANDTVKAVVMTVFIFFIVVPPVVLVIINVTGQALDLYQAVSDYIREGRLESLIDQIRALPLIQRIEANVFQWEPLKENMTASLLGASKASANFAISQVGVFTKNLFLISLNVVLMFFLVFVFFKDGEAIYNFVYAIAPIEEDAKKSIFAKINDTFSAVIRGQLLTSLVQSVIAGIAFWLLGIPASIFFAGATFLATLVPVVGASAIWLSLTVYLITIQAYVKAAILAAVGLFIISLIDNIMKPALIGEKTKLPYVLLFFGILGGLKVYGLMGIFLAPVMLTLFFVLAKIFQEKYS
ncbi:MAG: AI-2E family transporter [Candidatus Omnitrophota bacterium]|nr:AI-2E family transporter [Candidatus Omnitrophota bacterium]